jgi:hypothetical protein
MNVNLAAGTLSIVPQLPLFHSLTSNLLLVFAFSVLEDALMRLRDAGRFEEKGRELSRLMRASREALPWIDYELVSAGREARNAFAHRREYTERQRVVQYVDAVGAELVSWGLIQSDTRPSVRTSVTPRP